MLVEAVVKSRKDYDSLVFPIVFVYRQYLELRLKQRIKLPSYGRCADLY